MYEHPRRNAGYTIAAGIVLSLYGWMTEPLYVFPRDDPGYYNASLDVFYWALRGGGAALFVIAIISYAGLRIGLFLDAVITGLCGVVLFACSIYWMKLNGPTLINGVFAVFGVLFCKAAYDSLRLYKVQPGRPVVEAAAAVPATESIHPASVHPDALPKEGEPPPADGYLAALSKEKGEPPTASHR